MQRNTRECDICKRMISLSNFKNHFTSCSRPRIPKIAKIRTIWNKGKTKLTDHRIGKCAETWKANYKSGEIELNHKPLTLEQRDKISKSMKKAHAEGRAWNIGQSRWNNEPSYPEKWFMSVIENEFTDKEYTREYPFTKYSLDFAWVHLKKAIEIDGEQHCRFPEYSARDKTKDLLLCENGWQVLRLPWKQIFNNTKDSIKEMKSFIES